MPVPTAKASCTCGEVVFDLSSKQPGATLDCPWCKKRYRVKEGGRIVALVKKKESAAAKETPEPPAPKGKTSDEKKPSERKKAKSPEQPKESTAAATRDAKPATAPKKKKKKAKPKEDTPLEPAGEPALDALLSDSTEEHDADPDAAYSLEGEDLDRGMGEALRKPLQELEDAGEFKVLRKTSTTRRMPPPDLDRPERDDMAEPEPKPFNLERYIFYMFVLLVPVGALAYGINVWWGIHTGRYRLQTYKILGITIRGDNPWVWVAGMLLGGLTFLLAWVAYTYLFVYRQEKKTGAANRESGRDNRSRRTRRVED